MELWGESRLSALRCLPQAVRLDHCGDCEAAFGKYLESLNLLSLYLKDMLAALGFQKMVEKQCEITKVLSMIRECTDRVQIIVDTNSTNSTNVTVRRREENDRRDSISNDVVTPPSQKFPPFLKLQADNMRIIKQYQWRCERTKNYREKANIRLELERKLAENAVIAKQKYNTAVKQLQNERLHVMEQQMKELLDNRQPSTSLQRDKQRLYRSVFEYTKTETWTCAWKLNPLEMSAYEATRNIFHKTFKCTEHPISQEISLNQKVLKRRLEKKLLEYAEYKHVPDALTDGSMRGLGFHDMPHEYVININNGNSIIVPKPRLKSLNKFLESISSEITNNIENVLEVFYLIYKSLLPEDSEELCYRLIEAHILEPLWPSFISLFRLSNISSEYKISRTMKSRDCSYIAGQFKVAEEFNDTEVCRECITALQKLPNHISLNEKLKILVEICQAICGTSSPTSENQRKLGADDLMPLLCYIIVLCGMPQVCSECYAIEQLFNMKYSFGEEGYALSSFLTALKYIEFRVGVDD